MLNESLPRSRFPQITALTRKPLLKAVIKSLVKKMLLKPDRFLGLATGFR